MQIQTPNRRRSLRDRRAGAENSAASNKENLPNQEDVDFDIENEVEQQPNMKRKRTRKERIYPEKEKDAIPLDLSEIKPGSFTYEKNGSQIGASFRGMSKQDKNMKRYVLGRCDGENFPGFDVRQDYKSEGERLVQIYVNKWHVDNPTQADETGPSNL